MPRSEILASDQFGILLADSGIYGGLYGRFWDFLIAIRGRNGDNPRMAERENFMRRAIQLAREGMNSGAGGPFGAVIVRDGTIVGEGWNRVVGTNDPTAHGEITAIRDSCAKLGTFSLEGCEIHTTGQPCPMCLGAIHWARIRKIYYGFRIEDAAAIGFDDTEFFRQMVLPADERLIPSEELCREESLALAYEYTRLPGRRHY
jgi:guanine deaminase